MNASITPIKAAPPAASDIARQQRRDAHALIEMSYDLASHSYKDGYSDEKIAKETGLAKDWVAKRREDEFGPLQEPGEIALLRAEVASARELLNQVTKKLDDLCLKQGWKR